MPFFLRVGGHINLVVMVLFGLANGAYLIDFARILNEKQNVGNVKREGES